MTYRFTQQSVQLLFGSFRLHPSGIANNILGIYAIIKALRGLSVLSGRHLHNPDETAVKAGDGMKTNGFRDVQDGIFSALQQITGIGNPGMVHIIQRGRVHDVTEYPAEVGGTPMAQICQILHGELLAVI